MGSIKGKRNIKATCHEFHRTRTACRPATKSTTCPSSREQPSCPSARYADQTETTWHTAHPHVKANRTQAGERPPNTVMKASSRPPSMSTSNAWNPCSRCTSKRTITYQDGSMLTLDRKAMRLCSIRLRAHTRTTMNSRRRIKASTLGPTGLFTPPSPRHRANPSRSPVLLMAQEWAVCSMHGWTLSTEQV